MILITPDKLSPSMKPEALPLDYLQSHRIATPLRRDGIKIRRDIYIRVRASARAILFEASDTPRP